MIKFTGSQWRKWDLHVHTPFTKLSNHYRSSTNNDLWKLFCDKIEKSDVQAFGITDYFCADEYFTFIEKHRNYYPGSEKVFFPNIELRLEVSVNKKAEEVNIHVIFSNTVSKKKIDEFLSSLNTNRTRSGATISCKNLESTSDYESAGVDYKKIRPILKKVFGDERCYVVFAAANNAGLRPDTNSPRKLAVTDEIDKICDGFFGGIQNIDYYLNAERELESGELAEVKPVIGGSDAHSFEDLDNFLGKRFTRTNEQGGRSEIVKDVTWIKGDLTFEGLKQIKFEPRFRVLIAESDPREPIRKIESVQFKFPENITIKKHGSGDHQVLCIKNLKDPISFSPYFTCLIGGRGTGKSTIINLIAERCGNPTEFFHPTQNSLYKDNLAAYNLKTDVDNYIEVSGTNDVEFVSQGRVEKLTEGEELTKLIFNERILQPNLRLQEIRDEISGKIKMIEQQIQDLKDLESINREIAEKTKEKNKLENVINSINDPIFIAITDEIQRIGNELSRLKMSESRYSTLVNRIHGVITETPVLVTEQNEYEKRIGEIVDHLLTLDEIELENDRYNVVLKTYPGLLQTQEDLTKDLSLKEMELNKYFESKGTSVESIQDSQNATLSVTRLDYQIKLLWEKGKKLDDQITNNADAIRTLVRLSKDSKAVIQRDIHELNQKLIRKNDNVLSIKYEFTFNEDRYLDELFDDFHSTFKDYHITNTSWDAVKETLYLVKPGLRLFVMSYEDFKLRLRENIDPSRMGNNYVVILLNIFSNNTNFKIYQLLLFKHLFNTFRYIDIEGFYGKRKLSICSFGQKCTAVIVTLLMTGVKPLLIDEPEAHLDNRLIAEYLVDLIQEKKMDRQLIFATHNANFVVNGDSELIYVLEVPDEENCTVLTATTIENLKFRKKLLKLEGGEGAFQRREKRLLSI